jgi:FixJ family two-component response regulator
MAEERIIILVIDDETIIHESCARILREQGYEVDSAMNGQEALQKLQERRYNLVLSDIKMPGMDGVQTLELMKRHAPDITVIMFTGFASVDTARATMKLGAFDYLPKPFTPDELLSAVQKALASERAARRQQVRESQFHQLVNSIHATLNLREVLNLIVTGVTGIFAVKGCSISLLDRKREFFKVCAASGLSSEYLQKGPITADRYLSTVLAGSPDSIIDVTTAPQADHLYEAHQEGIASIFAFPIKLKQEVIGMIRLYSGEAREFTTSEIEFLNRFIEQASIALENARTYEDVRERYESLKDDLWEWCEYDSQKIS